VFGQFLSKSMIKPEIVDNRFGGTTQLLRSRNRSQGRTGHRSRAGRRDRGIGSRGSCAPTLLPRPPQASSTPRAARVLPRPPRTASSPPCDGRRGSTGRRAPSPRAPPPRPPRPLLAHPEPANAPHPRTHLLPALLPTAAGSGTLSPLSPLSPPSDRPLKRHKGRTPSLGATLVACLPIARLVSRLLSFLTSRQACFYAMGLVVDVSNAGL
jgi:hypothetical protein